MKEVKIKVTIPLPLSTGDVYTFEDEVTLEELSDMIRVYSKPSVYGPLGFTIEFLPR